MRGDCESTGIVGGRGGVSRIGMNTGFITTRKIWSTGTNTANATNTTRGTNGGGGDGNRGRGLTGRFVEVCCRIGHNTFRYHPSTTTSLKSTRACNIVLVVNVSYRCWVTRC